MDFRRSNQIRLTIGMLLLGVPIFGAIFYGFFLVFTGGSLMTCLGIILGVFIFSKLAPLPVAWLVSLGSRRSHSL